ncbi:kynureninase [Allonocardiopsis opalescens]|uniref:Kynureninase n=1 Tax=Allonocardiopsis opalescens TaxID=1144618 RepID=A0A2T0PX69_9ACTN|nr:kynureninase [Allonocardiopsis opalescens]PRX96121.1 kynureninase [Allonocardiopsis opalescens]
MDGLAAAFADAAEAVDGKWPRAFARADRVRAGFRTLLHEPGADIALGASAHDLLVRFLSALDLRRRPRLVTTDGEFHSLRRQFDRLAEEGVQVVRVPARPVDGLAERLAAAVDDRTAAVCVSAVLFETAEIVPALGELAGPCARHGAELLVDAYHALGPVPFPVPALGLRDAWVLGGGYKYLQLGEGNCFLRLPGHAAAARPVVTGWFAEFTELPGARSGPGAHAVGYAPGADRFAGSTYDPVSHYRASAVLDFFDAQGLTPAFLREVYRHQLGRLAAAVDALDLPAAAVRREPVPLDRLGGFLALRSPQAALLCAGLAERGVLADSRGPYLRLGPAPYLSDAQLDAAAAALGEAAAALPRR